MRGGFFGFVTIVGLAGNERLMVVSKCLISFSKIFVTTYLLVSYCLLHHPHNAQLLQSQSDVPSLKQHISFQRASVFSPQPVQLLYRDQNGEFQNIFFHFKHRNRTHHQPSSLALFPTGDAASSCAQCHEPYFLSCRDHTSS
jgi:hypothetical protein